MDDQEPPRQMQPVWTMKQESDEKQSESREERLYYWFQIRNKVGIDSWDFVDTGLTFIDARASSNLIPEIGDEVERGRDREEMT